MIPEAHMNGANTQARKTERFTANQARRYHGHSSYGCTKANGSGMGSSSGSSTSAAAASLPRWRYHQIAPLAPATPVPAAARHQSV